MAIVLKNYLRSWPVFLGTALVSLLAVFVLVPSNVSAAPACYRVGVTGRYIWGEVPPEMRAYVNGKTQDECLAANVPPPVINLAPPATAPPVTGGPANQPPITDGSGNLQVTLTNPLKSDSLYCFLKGILDVVVAIGSILVVLLIIYAGFLFVTARGDETQLKTAKKAFLYTFIGAAVLLGAWVLTQVIVGTINALRPADQQITTPVCPN